MKTKDNAPLTNDANNELLSMIRRLANCDHRGVASPLAELIYEARLKCGWTKKEAAR